MIRHGSSLLTSPALVPPEDLLAVLDAALRIVVLAWIRIRRARRLTEAHRSNEPRTAGLLFRHMEQVECERSPRRPPMKIKTEAATFSSDEQEIPDGRIDIEIIYSLDEEPDLRLECKRVSATLADDPKERARYYVADGVLRFVSNKYGRDHRWGVLIAFVIDGRFEPAMRIVADYVTRYRNDPPHLLSRWLPASWLPPRRHLFTTEHRQGGGPGRIRLLHLFLPFPQRRTRQEQVGASTSFTIAR